MRRQIHDLHDGGSTPPLQTHSGDELGSVGPPKPDVRGSIPRLPAMPNELMGMSICFVTRRTGFDSRVRLHQGVA